MGIKQRALPYLILLSFLLYILFDNNPPIPTSHSNFDKSTYIYILYTPVSLDHEEVLQLPQCRTIREYRRSTGTRLLGWNHLRSINSGENRSLLSRHKPRKPSPLRDQISTTAPYPSLMKEHHPNHLHTTSSCRVKVLNFSHVLLTKVPRKISSARDRLVFSIRLRIYSKVFKKKKRRRRRRR